MQKQRVLVTGGAGFIGSELVRQLAARGLHVRVVDNLATGRRENLEDLDENVELLVADIRDRQAMNSVLRSTDIVFHLACLGAQHSTSSPGEIHEVNGSASLELLIAARDAGVNRFVYVSSSGVYGAVRTAPITEEHPTQPMTVYGASKLAGEAYTRALWETYNFPTVVLRLFDAYGPRCRHAGDGGEVISKFMLRCLAGKPMVIFGDGTQAQDLTFVSDAAHGILSAGFSDAAVGHTFNLGSGKEIKIEEFARVVAQVAGKQDAQVEHVEPISEGALPVLADCSKTKTLLGFEPAVTLLQGLTQLRDWYLTQDDSPQELLEQEVA